MGRFTMQANYSYKYQLTSLFAIIAMAWSKASLGWSGFLVPLLAVAARLVLVFPACLCLYDYFCVVRFCFGSINAMNASDFALCPLAALIFSFQSMVGPYRAD